MTLQFVQSDSGVEGTTYAQFSQPFSGFTVQPGQIGSSGIFDNVLLTQGALASLGIIPLGFLDVDTASTIQVGDGGYTIPWLHLHQDHVPTDYTLSLGLAAMKAKAQAISASSAAGSSTTALSSTSSSAPDSSVTESSAENSTTEASVSTSISSSDAEATVPATSPAAEKAASPTTSQSDEAQAVRLPDFDN